MRTLTVNDPRPGKEDGEIEVTFRARRDGGFDIVHIDAEDGVITKDPLCRAQAEIAVGGSRALANALDEADYD